MKIQYAIGALIGAAAFCSLNASASQYLGVGAEYGVLKEQYSGAEYPILNFETRFGMDFSDRFSVEVEGAVLGKDDREFEGVAVLTRGRLSESMMTFPLAALTSTVSVARR